MSPCSPPASLQNNIEHQHYVILSVSEESERPHNIKKAYFAPYFNLHTMVITKKIRVHLRPEGLRVSEANPRLLKILASQF